jgi:gliding motility-associated-like protein
MLKQNTPWENCCFFMSKKIKIFSVIAILLSGYSALSQNLSNKGKEFWVAYGHHQFFENGTNSQGMVLYLNSEQPAQVTVSITGTSYVRNFTIAANSVIATDTLPKSGPEDCRLFSGTPGFSGANSEGISSRGIHIQSNVPIVAYAHIFGGASSGATMLMPVETYGYSYVSVNSQQNYPGGNCFSWMYVIAKENNTKIEIVPSVPTRGGFTPGQLVTVVLNKGQVYQLLGALTSTGAATGYDLTGTTIKSVANSAGECFPIAVFSGSSRTYITCSGGAGNGGDNAMQQVFPYQAWGKRYLTAPTSNGTPANSLMTNLYRVVVKDPATVVTRNGFPLTGLINNLYYQYSSGTADYIEADKPVMVAQYMASNGGCPNVGTAVGDPEMMYISPIEQAIKRVGFYRNNLQSISVNYLTLIIPTIGVASLTIDGSNSFDYTYSHPNFPGYTVVIKRWNSPLPPAPAGGQCIVQSDSAFTAVTYGEGGVESYGYNAGTLINNLNVIAALHNSLDSSVTSHAFTCKNTPAEISMFVAYKPTSMVWKLSQVPTVSPNADVTVSSPSPIDSMQQNGVWYYKYRLPGTYSFSDTGTVQISVKNTHPSLENCNNSEIVTFGIAVKMNPVANFSFVHTGCMRDSVQFSSPNNSGNGYTVNNWMWSFDDATNLNGSNPVKIFGSPGLQNIHLKVISTEGCVGDTIRQINIYAPPATTFGTTPVSLCEGNSVSFSDTSSYGGSAAINTYYWDFGNSNVVTTGTNTNQTITFPTYGTYTVKHVVKVSPTCISDTATKLITVYAKPLIGFTYPAGCLPTNGIVQFNSTTTVPDGQTLNYNWDFGDPNANAGNPNTSIIANPNHTYNYGTYTIHYTVTTANGCMKDTTLQATFNVKPSLAYTALSPVCESVAGTVSVAFGSVTNSVAEASHYYSGPATTAAGLFTPSQAGPGTHTIWYVFTSSGGCKDSISQTIQVYARPKPGFTFPSGCLPPTGLVQFTGSATIADGQSMTYNWNFNDPNANAGNPNTASILSPSHTFSPGTYNIVFTVTSSNGCVTDSTKTVTFNLIPQLSYPYLASVCQNLTSVSVATATVTNGVTGNGVYSGPGTSAAGIFNPSAAGAGTHTIKYIFTSGGGCLDSISRTIKVFPKPIAKFGVNNSFCIDQQANLTDTSSIASGRIATWNWNFGDVTTASNLNGNPFSHPYAAWGSYTIKLVTVSDSTCASDTAYKTIAVHPLPVTNFNLPATICMPDGITSFTNTSTIADNSALSYVWNFGDLTSSNSTNPSHTYTGYGPYTIRLTATSPYGCVKDSVKILGSAAFVNEPVANFTVSPDTLCQGANNVFTDLSTPAGSIQSWDWNFGDGSPNGTTSNPTKKYTRPGHFGVTLVVKNSAGCISDPFTDSVIVFLQPVIDAGPSFVVPEGTIVTFNPTFNDTVTVHFMWTPASDFPNPAMVRPSIMATHNQTYTLTATGLGNCSATDTMSVKILKPVDVPNSFSPNGDGINDTWVIKNLSDYPGATVEVFNRYGQTIYKSSGYGTPWNGTFKGSPVPFATYYYVIVLKNGFKPLSGSVTIVR